MVTNRVAGVAGRPQASNFNECDNTDTENDPVELSGNPIDCRTFGPLDSRPIKTILAERLKVYENAHPACKEGLGLFLKTTLADVQAKAALKVGA